MAVRTTGQQSQRPRAIGAQTMCEAFQMTAADHADAVALRTKGGEFTATWAEYSDRVRRLSAGLASLGVGRGDTVGIMVTNRPEFHFVDTAAMHLGATPFSVYNSYTPDQVEYLVKDAENRVLVTEQALLEAVLAVRDAAGSLEHVVVVDGEAPAGVIGLDELAERGEEGFDFEATWRAVEPDDVLTLIYTSGTTGPPKGVQITHRNMTDTIRSYDELIRFPAEGRIVSYLPMAHIAERNVSQYLPMAVGFSVTCCPDPRQVIAYMPEVRPSWFFAVPRIWEKLKAALEAGMAAEPDERKRQGMQWAMEVGRRKVRAEQAGEEVSEELAQEYAKADELVFSKIRANLGMDRLESVNVGAAPTPYDVLEFFHAIGIPVAELWGMSETTGAGACNPPDAIRIGTVGPPGPGMEIKLAEDGEVLIRGSVVMPGYRNQPEKTAETIDEDGWLHTGDVGEFDDAGYLKIVDRKKELIINAAGKNMSPANIEAEVKSASPLIGQAAVIGDGRPYNVALIVLDPDVAPGFIDANGRDAVRAEVEAGVARANDKLARVEQIKRFTILEEEWLPGGDELTPTMKLRRRPIAEKYAEEIEALYAG